MSKTITLIEGDGIGPEVINAVKQALHAAGAPITWEEENAGAATLEKTGELIPRSLIESVKRNRIALKGPITTPVGKGFKSVNVQLRQLLDLYANVRPCYTTPGLATRFENVDLVIFRENTEGLYSGLEIYDERLKISDTLNRISYQGSYRIIKAAFEYARTHGRKKVTLVHKANILKSAGRTFLDAGKEVAVNYPEIECDDKIIDNTCMQLVTKPEQFDIIVTTNLFGDILSDLCAGLVGGLGVTAGANLGNDIALFEAVHGSAPDIAGKGIANPTAVLRSAVMMLRHIGEQNIAENVNSAINKTLADRAKCTGDLHGEASTEEFSKNIIANLN